MQISIFHDEINPDDPARALHLAAAWGVSHIEVRSLPGGRFPRSPDAELETFYKQICDAGLTVSGVSPGFFKCPLDDPSVIRDLAEGLPRACEWAHRFGTNQVSSFAFRKGASEHMPQGIVDRVAEMAAITARHDCRLVLENEAGCWGGTGTEAAAIIRQIGPEHLGLCWDPGNAVRAGSSAPYPDEYGQIKDLLAHVHMKNWDPRQKNWQLIERGLVDWPDLLRTLQASGFSGFAVVETHLKNLPDDLEATTGLNGQEASTYRNLEFVRSCLELA